MVLSEQPIDVIVLAGGRGERMGGEDKGWVSFGASSFIEATLDAFAGALIRPLISANRNLQRYCELAAKHHGLVVQDLEQNFNGPLGGLAAAAAHLQSDWVIVVPCDTPLLGPVFLQRMLKAAATKPSIDGFMANDGRRTQPLHCLLKRSVLEQLPAFMAISREKQPGMMGWAQQFALREVDFSDEAMMFENINTPEALEAVKSAGTQSLG